MAATHRHLIHRVLAVCAVVAFALGLSGCDGFFVCQKTSCPSSGSGGSGSTSGNYAYVSNSASGSTKIEGYSLGSGTLASLSGFPLDIGYTPTAMAITPTNTPTNTYLYVAQQGTGYIHGFGVSSAGALTTLSGGAALATPVTGTTAIDISPDGNYLFALDTTGAILYEYSIAPSTGLLSVVQSFPITNSSGTIPQSVKVSPNNNFVACALGTGGTVVFPYNSSTGISSAGGVLLTTGSAYFGDFALAMDTNNVLYVARTSGAAVYQVTFPTSTSVAVNSVTQAAFTSGTGPHAIVLAKSSGGYVYVGNTTSGNISAYSVTSAGALSDVTGSPFAAPPSVAALARDNSGKYILAAGLNSTSGIQLYTIGSSGGLTLSTSAASGTSGTVPVVMALTH